MELSRRFEPIMSREFIQTKPLMTTYTGVSIGATRLNIGLRLHLHSYYVYTSSYRYLNSVISTVKHV